MAEGIGEAIAPTQALIKEKTLEHQLQTVYAIKHDILGIVWPHHGISPSTVVFAAWSILAARYSDSTKVNFCSATSLQQAGVPVQVMVEPDKVVGQLLQVLEHKGLQEMTQKQTHCQDSQHESLKSEIEGNELQGLLVVETAKKSRGNHAKTSQSMNGSGNGNGTMGACGGYAIVLNCEIHDDALQLYVSFAPNMSFADNVPLQMEKIIRQIIGEGGNAKRLKDIEMTTERDLRNIWEWNATGPAAVEACLHDVIAEQARQHPDAPAICAWDGQLTYAELNDLSTGVAQYLCVLGIGLEKPVALYLDKSIWAFVAIVGVLKAGGVCIPLSPTYPMNRTWMILEETQAEVIMIDPKYEVQLQGKANHLVAVTHPFVQSAGKVSVSLPEVSSRSAAFIFYTSGSTGKSKGVVQEHGAIYTTVREVGKVMGVNNETRCFQFASFVFDPSICDLFATLMFGGCVCVPSEENRLNNLALTMSSLRVTSACLTATTLNTIHPDDIPSLETVTVGGESLNAELVMLWGSRVHLNTIYGTTETVIWDTFNGNITEISKRRNIGRGVGCSVWVVDKDDDQRLLPVGAIGELLISGPGLARGYLNDTEKTRKSFVNSPAWYAEFHGQNNMVRFYKTGDLVRYNPDGTLVFVGRKDAQVKIRGQRVELGEVEHHVRRNLAEGMDLPVVAEVITPRGGSNPALVAYLAIGKEANTSPDMASAVLRRSVQGLDDRLAAQLPGYMVPSAYVQIEQIPMTATGKTDRRRLRELGGSLTLEQLAALQPARGQRRAPTTKMERQLHQLWASILGIDGGSIGADDSFLRIGGDSIGAMRLVGAAREQGLSFTVADVFNHPRLCDLAQLVKAGNHDNEAIAPFSLLKPGLDQQDTQARAAAQCSVDTHQIEDVFPCTPLQEGLLAMTAKRPGDYVSSSVLELRGDVDIGRFEQAWEEVISTTAILRTWIVDLPGQGLVQVVITDTPEWTASQDLHAYLADDQQQPMGLGTALARFALVKDCGHGKHYFVWTMHHAVYDGWSMPLILDQVEQVYQHKRPAIPTPFQGFVRHIMEIDEDVGPYWEAQLAGSEAVPFPSLPSPGYEPRADQTLQHQVAGLEWPQNDITASTAVRAAWAILTARYTNASDAIVGATVTGRQAPVPGIERIAGPTIATVPVRVRVDWEGTVDGLLQQVQAQAIAMTPFEQTGLQQIRRMSPDMEQQSQFQTLLVVQPASQANTAPRDGGLFEATSDDGEHEDAGGLEAFNTYAMMVECQLAPHGVQLQVSFDSRVVEREQVQRMAQQLEHVLRQICDAGTGRRSVKEVETASEQDLRDIWEWNATVPAAVEACVHDLITERTRQQPDAPAICAWDGELTYAELDERSTWLAHQLVRLGVGPGTIVPLCFEKSMWMPVAMLGVMKAGGASVAMDTTQPEERLRSIMQQVCPTVIVCSTMNQGLAGRFGVQDFLVVDRTHCQQFNKSGAGDLPTVDPSNMLYVVFTSGSTGSPKGVIISHANFSAAIYHQRDILHFTSRLRVLDFASYSFDAAWGNVLQTLTCGACLCIPSEMSRKNGLAEAMRQLDVTYADLTPSTARLLNAESVPCLRTLALGGEPLTVQDTALWASSVTLINGYGPSECTPASICANMSEGCAHADTIGHGYGLTTWVVEPSKNCALMPIGAVGELWLEGPLVGQGYLGDPQKTAAAFVEDPPWLLRGGPGRLGRRGRLYQTGDLVRYNPDGTLVFIGRKDAQVKIRGQRVELGEVEHHVRRNLAEGMDLPVVAEVITPRASSNPVLVAYVAIGEDANASPNTASALLYRSVQGLDDRLAAQLPGYMVPSAYVQIEQIPMTATGKTDRRRLRELGGSLTLEQLAALQPARGQRRAPTTKMERQLHQLWASILGIDSGSIGADDSFLRIGGDSIGAMRLVRAAREQGLSFTVADVFSHPRLCDLAQLVKPATAFYRNPAPFSLITSPTPKC